MKNIYIEEIRKNNRIVMPRWKIRELRVVRSCVASFWLTPTEDRPPLKKYAATPCRFGLSQRSFMPIHRAIEQSKQVEATLPGGQGPQYVLY